MQEITRGIHHWSARHPKIGIEVSSYWLPELGVLIDPVAVPEEVEGVDEILLSNRHHRRDSLSARERFGATVRAPRVGMHEFGADEQIEPYDFGDTLAGGGVTVYEVGGICPDEAAFHIPSVGALSVADGVMHYDDELDFVTDDLMDEPELTKERLRAAYARLVDELEFEHLLLAHGDPVVGAGRDRLRAFAAG
jgi:glyoxylase-like metal-dependent hydrolase (beta-lactamase superfamily II)